MTPAVLSDPSRFHYVAGKPTPISPPRAGPVPAVLGRAAEMHRPKPLCRHCGKWPVTRRRGLCNACYYDPQIRAATPILNAYGRRGVGGDGGLHPPPSKPTRARPGGRQKLQVLAQRAEAGLELFHPQDTAITPRPE